MHVGFLSSVNHVLVSFTLEHVLSLLGRVAEDHAIVAPHTIIGRHVVLNDLVDITLSLGNTAASDTSHANAQFIGIDVGA